MVLWEMMTLAEQPYQGLSNEEALRYIAGGGIMDKPQDCPDRMYVYCHHFYALSTVMCWRYYVFWLSVRLCA